MSFEDILDRHNDHIVVIIPRIHKNKDYPINGLYCQDCAKLIKWLNDSEAKTLIDSGVEELPMLKSELIELQRKKYKRLITAKELGI